MSTELLEKWIEEDFGYSSTGKWGKSKDHDSLVLNKESGYWFWNSQGIHGNAYDYLIKVRRLSPENAKQLIKNSYSFPVSSSENHVSTPYDKLVDYLWESGKNERTYWYKRCLNDSTIDRFRLGFYEGWYTLPIYVDGKFVNFQCRRDEPKKLIRPWYKGISQQLFNADILRFTRYVYITEGPVDAILLNQYGYPAVSHNGGSNYWNPEWSFKFKDLERIFYIADNDKAGIKAANLVASHLGTQRVKVIRFSDLSEKADFVDYVRDGMYTDSDFAQRTENSKFIFEGI